MTDILIQPNADDDDDLSNGVVIDDATLPLSNQSASALGLTLGTTYQARVLGAAETFSVTDVPAQMSAPTVTATGETSISVDMAAAPNDGGSTITSYDLRWQEDGGGWTIVTDISDPETVSSLTDDTLYNVQTRAVNAIGAGPWSSSGSDTTDEAVATGFTVTNVGGNQLDTTGVAITEDLTIPITFDPSDYSAGDEVIIRLGMSVTFASATFNGNAATYSDNSGPNWRSKIMLVRYVLTSGDVGTTQTTTNLVLVNASGASSQTGYTVDVVSGDFAITTAMAYEASAVASVSDSITPSDADNTILSWIMTETGGQPINWSAGMTELGEQVVSGIIAYASASGDDFAASAQTITATFAGGSYSGAIGLVCISGT